jgi:hypothetical protein
LAKRYTPRTGNRWPLITPRTSIACNSGIARNGHRLIHILCLLTFLAVAEGPQNPCGAIVATLGAVFVVVHALLSCGQLKLRLAGVI